MTDNRRIQTLIVDDEPLARERIREMLKSDPDVEIAGECGTGSEAVAMMRERTPHLLFLDVQMPEMDGFAVLKTLGRDRIPHVIFVTAFDKYAVRAFEVYALDYILKPFKRARFKEALERAKSHIRLEQSDCLNQRTFALLESLEAKSNYARRLMIKTGGKIVFRRTDEIDWIEAEDNYVRLHFGKQSHLVRDRLANIESQLDPKKFVRIHRSTIVNIDRIRELAPWSRKDHRVVLQDGTQLALSRSCWEKFRAAIGKPA